MGTMSVVIFQGSHSAKKNSARYSPVSLVGSGGKLRAHRADWGYLNYPVNLRPIQLNHTHAT
jgi:hypothetical protein